MADSTFIAQIQIAEEKSSIQFLLSVKLVCNNSWYIVHKFYEV